MLEALKDPRRRSIGIALASLLAASVWSRPASATDSSATAQALFDEAKSQMAKGNYARACPALEDSQKLDPALGTILNLADCYEKWGRTASAWSKFVEAQAKAQKTGHKDAEKVAKDRAQALERRLSKLTITVTAADSEPGLEITRDGVGVGPSEFGLAIPVDPGAHVIAAKAPGRKPWEARVEVANAAAASTVIPELEKAPEPVVAPAPTAAAAAPQNPEPAPAPADTSKPSSSRKTIGLIVGGLGVAAVATGGVFAALTKSKDNEADKLCNTGTDTCADSDEKKKYEDVTSDATRNKTISIVAFSVGGAALAAGAILFFGGSSSSAKSAVNVAPAAGPGEAGVVAWGRF